MEDQDLRFVCKLCNKRYSCGKALGGHMRSHVMANPTHFGEQIEANMKKISSSLVIEQNVMTERKCHVEFGNGQSSYGLRENPRKTWRAVDSTFPLPQERVCKQCGKVFQSMKALCGHMASHSERDRCFKDDCSWTSEDQKMALDSYSDTEESNDTGPMTRSSIWNKYKTFENVGSSSVSEIDGQDQEEVALCLMLLSKDCGNKGGVINSVVESSDNNSVVLETISSSIDMGIGKKGGVTYPRNGEEAPQLEQIGDKKLECSNNALNAEIAKMENSDSGYFLDECAKAESDVSVDGFRRNRTFGEQEKSFMRIERGAEEFHSEFRKSLKNEICNENEYGDATMASNFARSESRKRKHGFEDPELWNGITRGTTKDPPVNICSDSQKRSKYECFNCKKTFKSYQALGGHRPCHKRSNGVNEHESGENSLDDSAVIRSIGKRKSIAKSSSQRKMKPLKSKGHVCPFCDRVFKNGQALGGHKRSHFIGGNVINQNQHRAMKPEHHHDLLDLNLPAPMD